MRAVALLVALPVLFFAIPAAIGHPAITGDNLIQNFPLRVLTGDQLREGHLPLWNPYIWSGSPLLAGLNSGSFYPFTFAFAVLGPIAAWVVNLLGVYWAGGLGTYALARQYRLRPLASLLGALSYAYAGTMSGQIVHLGVVEGMGWMPLLVLAALRLSWSVLGTGPVLRQEGEDDAGTRASPWPWVALLAALVGLEALTGEPRAIAETEVVGVAVTLWLVLRPYARTRVTWRRRAELIGLAVLAAVWGAALAAAELAPGWSFIEASQRAVESYSYFGAGSLRVSWTLLLFVPDLFGGNGLFGQVRYFNNYNLTEVTGYVGLLPLCAALALLIRSFGRRRSRLASDWGLWLFLAGFGLLLAWGSFTPLGHIWAAIPLFGKTRLQSRNLEIVDLALALLFAFFADRLLSGRSRTVSATRARRVLRCLPALPAAVAFALCAVTLAFPRPVEEWLDATPGGAALARELWPWWGAEMLIACGVALFVVAWRRASPRLRSQVLAGIVVADLALFALATSTVIAPPAATAEPSQAAAAAVLGTAGRFGIVDTATSRIDTMTAIGQPDLNAFTHLSSVQGYGSIVAGPYGDATGTHTLDTVSACALRRGVFAPLRLDTLLVYAGNLAKGLAPAPAPSPQATAGALAKATAHAAELAATCPGARTPGTPSRRVLYLGWPVDLVGATLVSLHPPGSMPLRVAVVTPSGSTTVPAESVVPSAQGWSVTFERPERAVGIVVEGPAMSVSETSSVSAATGGRWGFEGTAQDAVDTSAWRYTGTFDGALAVFKRTGTLRPPVWLGGHVAGSSVRQVSTTDWGTTVDHVEATRPVTVVWSEAYRSGWHATIAPAAPAHALPGSRRGTVALGHTDRSRVLDVHADGLIQSVRVPAGDWTLTFSYKPALFDPGVAASLVATGGFVLFGVVSVRRRRRRHRAGGGARVAQESVTASR